jgi:hypothetical protein
MQDEKGTPLAKSLGLIESDLGQTLLIFNIKRQSVIALNMSARIAWISMTSQEQERTHLAKNLGRWYTSAKPAELEAEVERIVTEFISAGLLVPSHEGGFLEGKEVNVTNRSTIAYERAAIKEYPLQWLKEHHPAAFTTVMFSDTWSPADAGH